MSFSSAKCEVMHFSRKRKPCSHLDRTYSLAGQQLRSVPNIKDLGVTIASDLSWSIVDSSGTTWANETQRLRLQFQDDFEVDPVIVKSPVYSKG